MNEMVERVALAMQEACEGPAGDFDKRPHETYVKCARAAIEAMRKPTKAMFDEAMPHLDSWSSNIEWWHKMIDGALK